MMLPMALRQLLPPALHASCVGVLYRRNERLFLTGQPPQWMFFVVQGEVTLERAGLQGEPVIVQRTRHGFVSEASLKVTRYHCDAVAITDTQVIKVPARALAAAMDIDPAFAARWIGMLTAEVHRLRLHLERLSMKSVQDRLLHLIQTEGQAGQYDVPSGLKTLAGELGVTHEALYRTMALLQKSGRLLKRDGTLVLRPAQPS
ncbi:MAG: Crp/Fnr family transcriptional regulator [Limnohabitans sp.]